MSAIDQLLANNAAYAATFDKGGLPVPPAKRVAVVTCMDARMVTGAFLGLTEGDAHVIRNAGGIATDDVIRSLILSQRLLGTREIMLIQHTGCGLHGLAEDELKQQVLEETGGTPPFNFGAFEDLDDNVRRSLKRLRNSPYLPHSDTVRGFVFAVESGQLREVT